MPVPLRFHVAVQERPRQVVIYAATPKGARQKTTDMGYAVGGD